MQALKITWTFTHPLVLSGGFPLHFDALLAWARVQEAEELGEEYPWEAQEDLPLEETHGVWKASKVSFDPLSQPEIFSMTRKFDLNALSLDMGRVYETRRAKNKFNAASGEFKAYDMRVSCQWMKKAEAWCVGDKDRIEELLRRVTHIGRLTRNGFGRVKTVSIESCPVEETENWRLRALPLGSGQEKPGEVYCPSQQTCRPPYWKKTNTEAVVCPL